jgi:hypothetical protein
VAEIYRGGSEELKPLFDALVRTRGAIGGLKHEGENPPKAIVHAHAGQFGRVAHPYKDMTLVAFLVQPKEVPPPIEKLRLSEFFVMRVSWADFRSLFDIEVP